ncbi:MAG: hypothetical protein QXX38_01520 [Candidatus Aenigmatarchaeota archaeon]
MKELKVLTKNFKTKKIIAKEINELLLKKTKNIFLSIKNNQICGSSPPEIFVGRIGYPNVFIGPIVPPLTEKTENFAFVEGWYGKSLWEIVEMRLQMLRGKKRLRVFQVNERYALKLKEMLLSRNSVYSELKLKSFPSGFSFSEYHQPFGPSAILEDFFASPSRTEFKLEKVFYDTDFKASDAMFWLYEKELPVSKIQQAMSAGMFGLERDRKFVPTRWSITAVDDTLSKKMIEKIRYYPVIEEYRVYSGEYMKNKWVIILIPRPWSYEFIEAWFPGTINENLAIGGDYELFKGKKEYAKIGGCYYASRFSTTEFLEREKIQATVIVLREVYKGYLPLGVWLTRESVRNILKTKPFCFDSFDKTINFVGKSLYLPIKVWVENSNLFKSLYTQKSIFNFLNKFCEI